MIVGRFFGWIFIILSLMLFGSELLMSLRAGEWTPQLLGQLWFELHLESLNLTQAVIQRYLIPELWDPVLVEVLLWPAWMVFAIPGILLILLFRQKANSFTPRKYLN